MKTVKSNVPRVTNTFSKAEQFEHTGPGFSREQKKKKQMAGKGVNFSDRFTEASKFTYYIY